MKIGILTALVIGVLLTSVSFAKPKRQGHAHVHGEAKVDIGADGTKASISFNIDTHSLTGFEHAAKTAKEKAAVEKVYKTFRSGISKMFAFDPKLNCKFEERKLLFAEEGHHDEHDNDDDDDDDDHGHEGHQSLAGDYNVTCAKRVASSKVRIDLKSSFSAIQKLKVQVLSENGADSVELPGAGEINLR